MILFKSNFLHRLKRVVPVLFITTLCVTPISAHAAWEIVDKLDLSKFIPIIFNSMMTMATDGYKLFVGNGDGIIYMLVWAGMAVSLILYLIKMFFPGAWVSLFGFSGGGEMSKGISGFKVVDGVLKPGLRAIIATLVLLQIQPRYVTEWLINPFMQFGAVYAEKISHSINSATTATPTNVTCSENILQQNLVSKSTCDAMVKPVATVSHANNQIIKRGFEFLTTGLRRLLMPIPHGGEDFFSVVTGILLIVTFVSCNIFMALLMIQAIFDFCMSLILYPFQVLTWVLKTKDSDNWFDIWPAFSGITKALQQMIITMIACAFIVTINIAVVNALFKTGTTVFNVASGGSATSNVPSFTTNAIGFGGHSVLWLSSLLTFFVMLNIFQLTRKQIDSYVKAGNKEADQLYTKTTKDAGILWGKAKALPDKVKTVMGWVKKK